MGQQRLRSHSLGPHRSSLVQERSRHFGLLGALSGGLPVHNVALRMDRTDRNKLELARSKLALEHSKRALEHNKRVQVHNKLGELQNDLAVPFFRRMDHRRKDRKPLHSRKPVLARSKRCRDDQNNRLRSSLERSTPPPTRQTTKILRTFGISPFRINTDW